ncbi:hypothetical protein BC835DRAFT_1479714 [Cytidiella melzeri]|nr:hypothetical protein BC835DRAFT_1479714 [Cytidiella melzeri]
MDGLHWLERKNMDKDVFKNKVHLCRCKNQSDQTAAAQLQVAAVASSAAEIKATAELQPLSPWLIAAVSVIRRPRYEEMLFGYEWDPNNFAIQMRSNEVQNAERKKLFASPDSYGLWDADCATRKLAGVKTRELLQDSYGAANVNEYDEGIASAMENLAYSIWQ